MLITEDDPTQKNFRLLFSSNNIFYESNTKSHIVQKVFCLHLVCLPLPKEKYDTYNNIHIKHTKKTFLFNRRNYVYTVLSSGKAQAYWQTKHRYTVRKSTSFFQHPHFEAVIQPPGHTLRGTHKPILLFITILICFAPPPRVFLLTRIKTQTCRGHEHKQS
jgi:hypothetical protein